MGNKSNFAYTCIIPRWNIQLPTYQTGLVIILVDIIEPILLWSFLLSASPLDDNGPFSRTFKQ